MAITTHTYKSGVKVYRVCEYVGKATNGKRKRKSRTFKTMREAKAYQAKLRANKAALGNKTGHITLTDYVRCVWWQSLKDLTPATRTTYEKELRLRIIPALGKQYISDIDRTSVQRMVDTCKTQGTAKKAVQTLRTVLGEACADGLITINPASARFRLPTKRLKRDCGQVVTRFELMPPYIQAAGEFGKETGTDSVLKLMLTGFLMGLRPEERYGLDWADFSAGFEYATIKRAFTTSSKAEGGNHLKPPKTEKSARTVPIPKAAQAILAKLPQTDGAFMQGATTKRLSPSCAQKRIKRFYSWAAQNGYNLQYVTIENMRHSFATSYLHAGGNVEDLSRILGHTDINTTYKRYVRPSVDDLARGMNSVIKLAI